jgi:hypothetical protein
MEMLAHLIGPVTNLLDQFIEDKDQKAKLAHEIATMSEKHAQQQAMGQLEINKAEAQHRSIFVAGWRPFLGWVLSFAMPASVYFCSGLASLSWVGAVFCDGMALCPCPIYHLWCRNGRNGNT